MYTHALDLVKHQSPIELRAALVRQLHEADFGGQLYARVVYTRGRTLINVSNLATFLRFEEAFRRGERHAEYGLPIIRRYEVVAPPVTERAVVYVNDDGFSEATFNQWYGEAVAYTDYGLSLKISGLGRNELRGFMNWYGDNGKMRMVQIIGTKHE